MTPRPHIDGKWLDVARAVAEGAGNRAEVVSAIPWTGTPKHRQRDVGKALMDMQAAQLMGRDPFGRLYLTERGWDQMPEDEDA